MSVDDQSSCGCDSCGCGADDGDEAADSPFPVGDEAFPDDGDFHPMGAEWEDEMASMLDDTEYDTELGMEMAKDAQRLVEGELSEEEFADRYHDAVVEEFDVEDEELADALTAPESHDGIVDRLPGVDDDQSRREVMKKMGVGAGALGLAGLAGDDEEQDAVGVVDDDEGTRYGMVIDLERCDGCLQCVVGCMEEHDTSRGANWMYVLTYEDEKTDQENFLVRPCQHCSNAPCEKVCPVRARHTRESDGLVLTDYETCIGCRYCQVACPYGVNYFQWGEPDVPAEELNADHVYDERDRAVSARPPKGVMGKCTYCPTRQDGSLGEDMVGTTACMDACDAAGMSAIHFGDMNDPDSRPNRYLRRRADQEFEQDTQFDDPEGEHEETVTQWGKLSAFNLLEEKGTSPNVTYLGNEPGPEAEQVEGPVSYEAVGATDRRSDVTNLGAAANREGE